MLGSGDRGLPGEHGGPSHNLAKCQITCWHPSLNVTHQTLSSVLTNAFHLASYPRLCECRHALCSWQALEKKLVSGLAEMFPHPPWFWMWPTTASQNQGLPGSVDSLTRQAPQLIIHWDIVPKVQPCEALANVWPKLYPFNTSFHAKIMLPVAGGSEFRLALRFLPSENILYHPKSHMEESWGGKGDWIIFI